MSYDHGTCMYYDHSTCKCTVTIVHVTCPTGIMFRETKDGRFRENRGSWGGGAMVCPNNSNNNSDCVCNFANTHQMDSSVHMGFGLSAGNSICRVKTGIYKHNHSCHWPYEDVRHTKVIGLTEMSVTRRQSKMETII